MTTSTESSQNIRTTTIPDQHSMVGLLGTRDEMLKLVEDAFDVEFPDHMLSRQTFESVRSIAEAIEELTE